MEYLVLKSYSYGDTFMKNFKSFASSLIAVLAALIVTSCQQGGGGSSGTPTTTVSTTNTTTMNPNCVSNPAACQQGIYQQGTGFYPYNYNYGYNNGYPYGYNGGFYYTNNAAYLCSCPAGTIPTYNNYGGLGCVNSGYAYGGGYAYFSWGGGYSGATNNQWVNIPQVSNYTGYNQSNCYNGVVQSCLVDQPTCSAGYTCRATAAQSRLGLCVSNTSGGTGTQYSGGYR